MGMKEFFYLQGVDDMDEMKDLGKYEPGAIEEKWYNFWEEHGVFHDEPEEGKEPYSIVLPPPNVTGQLHMGHALDNTLQDILIRYKRMQGYNVLWLPGKDHAGIATQVKVEKQIAEEGLTKYDLGREKFWNAYGNGRKNTGIPSGSRSDAWGLPVIGAVNVLRWMMFAPVLSVKYLYPFMKKV